MNRVLLSAVAGILTLTLSSSAQAGGHGHGYSSSYSRSYSPSSSFVSHNSTSYRFSTTQPYHLQYGRSFSHGYYFYGRDHHFWTSSSWSSRYGRNLYWYPGNSSWYYWSAGLNGYYPISYITIDPPVVTVAPVTPVVPVAVVPSGPVPPAGPPVP